MFYIIAWVVLSMFVGAISKKRKLGEWPGFLLSLLLSPLIGFLIALSSPRKDFMVNGNHSPIIADEIEKLSNLRASGVLTEEEFNAQKAKLLR